MNAFADDHDMESDDSLRQFEALLCENRLLRARERTANYGYVSLAQAVLLTEALLAATSREEAFVAVELLFGSLLSGRGLTIFEVDGDVARPVATHGEGALSRPLSLREGLAKQALDTGVSVFDSKREERAAREPRAPEPEETMVIPIRGARELFGVIAATSSRVPLPPPPLDVLDVFARRAAETLERVSSPAPSRRPTLRLP